MLFSLYVISIDEFGSGSLLDFFRPSRLSQQQLVRLAEKFMAAVIFVQNLAVLLLTPAYLATAVTEEREKRSLELLQTTHLYDREIILGKLLGRLTHLAGVLLAGLPVLSLTQFMGGVDMAVLLANFAVTFMNLWTAGCICIMLLSVVCKIRAWKRWRCRTVHADIADRSCHSRRNGGASGKGSDVIILSQQYIGGDYWKLLEVLRALLLAHGVISSFCLVVALGGLRPFVLSQKALANVRRTRSRSANLPSPRMMTWSIRRGATSNGNGAFIRMTCRPSVRTRCGGRNSTSQAGAQGVVSAFLGLILPTLLVFGAVPLLAYVLLSQSGIDNMFPRPVTILAEWVVWLGLAYRISASVARAPAGNSRQPVNLTHRENSDIADQAVGGIYQGLPWAICSIAYQFLVWHPTAWCSAASAY